MISKHTGLMIAGAGAGINLIDYFTSRQAGGGVDPNKGLFYGTNGYLKSFPKAGLVLLVAGLALYAWKSR